MTARFTPDKKQLAYIRKHAGSKTDAQIAAALGLQGPQIRHVRKKHKIAGHKAGGVVGFWTDDRLEILRDLYLGQGRPAAEVAEVLGHDMTAERVRKRVSDLGWKRDPALAHRNYMAKRHPPKAAKPAKVVVVGLSDQELIAQYLAARQVTKCAPGWAAGLTAWELATRTAPPPGAGLTEQHRRNRAKRRAA